MTEIRLEICPELSGEWVYAKTVPGGSEGNAMFRFTALPPRARDRIDGLVARIGLDTPLYLEPPHLEPPLSPAT